MESSTILEDFLLSRSSLVEIIKFEHFERLFPKNVPKDIIQKVFEELIEQRESNCIQPSRQKIRDQFDVPLSGTIEKVNESHTITIGKYSINDLINRLCKLDDIFTVQNKLFCDQIAEVLNEIKLICDEFNELKYSKAWFRGTDENAVHDVIDETVRSVDKCNSFFNIQ